jgi:hypothetical protein
MPALRFLYFSPQAKLAWVILTVAAWSKVHPAHAHVSAVLQSHRLVAFQQPVSSVAGEHYVGLPIRNLVVL